MADMPESLERATSAYLEEPWTEAQHRRVKLELQQQLPGAKHGIRHLAAGGPAWAIAAAALVFLMVGAAIVARSSLFSTDAGGAAIAVPGVASASSRILVAGTELGDEQRETRGIFRDGSVVRLPQASKVRVLREQSNETRLELLAGRALFDIQKQPDRAFITVAEGVEVRVIGTRFEVELYERSSQRRVRIFVKSGVVEVRESAGAAATRLTAGQTLEVATTGSPPAREAPTSPLASQSPADVRPPTATGAAGVGNEAVTSPDSASLFKAASTARAAGQISEAVRLYTSLLERFPRDQRAGVAALELGRLRLDAQRDPARAAVAFRRAVQSAPNEGLREDASARLVEALDAMNQAAPCQAERSRYLARYPRGVHAAAVRARCAGR